MGTHSSLRELGDLLDPCQLRDLWFNARQPGGKELFIYHVSRQQLPHLPRLLGKGTWFLTDALLRKSCLSGARLMLMSARIFVNSIQLTHFIRQSLK